jgi:hypothetical protein
VSDSENYLVGREAGLRRVVNVFGSNLDRVAECPD